MGLFKITSILRHHLAVFVAVCFLAAGVGYGLTRVNPGFRESGLVIVTAPKSTGSLFAYNTNLLYLEYMLHSYVAGPQGQQMARSAGATGQFSLEMVNENNEELPYYKYPYLNLAASGGSATATARTFNAILQVLNREIYILQQNQDVPVSRQVTTRLAFTPAAPVLQRGSALRVFCALAAIAVMADLAAAHAARSLTSRRRRDSGTRRGARRAEAA